MSRKVAAVGKVMSHDIWKGSSLKGFETCNKRERQKRESPKEMIDGKELECWVVGVIVWLYMLSSYKGI